MMLKYFIQRFDAWLSGRVACPDDSEETLVLKKVWWIFVASCFLFPGLEVLSAFVAGEYKVAMLSTAISLFCLALLVLFHFYRRNIEIFGLAFQLTIVAVTSLKTLLTGGLIYTAGVVYVGLIGPIQAIIFPNKVRAVLIYLLYVLSVIGGTMAQPYLWSNYEAPGAYFLATYITKFIFGTAFVFFSLYFFTNELKKMKAEEARRMKEMDDLKTKFYTDITHEFRTPLSIILGMADQLRLEPDKWLHDGTQMIKNNGRRLLSLVNQMLDLSKLDAGAMPVSLIQEDIVAYVRYLTESFHSLAERKQIDLSVTASADQIEMDFDPEKIQSILSNLLSNAIRYTPEHGRIRVTVATESNSPARFLRITVTDNGIGIPKKLHSRIFDRYFQVKNHDTSATEGTGLGLALTREIIRLLGGNISVESEEGHGATFIVRLPLTRRAPNGHIRLPQNHLDLPGHLARESAGSVGRLSAGPNRKLTLLMIEDNADVIQYLRALLEQEYHLEVARDGIEGWEKAIAQVPDLVLSDVMMPRMNGFELCYKLKQDIRTSHIPVVLLTARADIPARLEGLSKGADAYLAKPFDRHELFVQIQNLIVQRKTLQERFGALHGTLQLPESGDALPREDAFLQEVRQTLEKHLGEEDFGIAELCRALGMSRSQLYRKFHALTNTTVHHFIRDIRLKKAHELLQAGNMTVTEVAIETGFKNLSHFSRVFSAAFGRAPSELNGRMT